MKSKTVVGLHLMEGDPSQITVSETAWDFAFSRSKDKQISIARHARSRERSPAYCHYVDDFGGYRKSKLWNGPLSPVRIKMLYARATTETITK